MTARRGKEGAVDQDMGHCVVVDAVRGCVLMAWEVGSV